jgi:hypothetical protein
MAALATLGPAQRHWIDAYGHDMTGIQGFPAMTAGAVSTSAAGTIAPTTAAGNSPTVTFATGQQSCDQQGAFTLNPVTAGGAQAAGAVAVITFFQSMPIVPHAILCTIYDDANAAAIVAKATSITANGFSFSVGVALTTAHTYTCVYHIIG